MAISQSIQFRYTSFVVVVFYMAVFTGVLFAVSTYVYDKIEYCSGIWIRNGFWLPVILVYALSLYAYDKWLYKFVEREGLATIYDNKIDIKLQRLHETILIENILNVEYKPYRGSWYALVITTKQKKLNINESNANSKKKNTESCLFKLFEELSALQVNKET